MKNNPEFIAAIPQLIEKRYSCRTYRREELPAELFGKLREHAATLTPRNGSALRFVWFDKREAAIGKLFSVGTYGLIKNSRYFMGLVVKKNDPHRYLDLGQVLEELVLYATFLGLDSCWIGGVFDRKGFAAYLKIAADEELPVVIALGHAAERRSIPDLITRWGSKGDLRKSPEELFFFEEPAGQSWNKIPEALQEILLLARKAPSASNRQPWRIIVKDNSLQLFLKRDPVYQKLMPLVDLQMVDIGIVLSHLLLVLESRGLQYELFDTEIATAPLGWQHMLSIRISN